MGIELVLSGLLLIVAAGCVGFGLRTSDDRSQAIRRRLLVQPEGRPPGLWDGASSSLASSRSAEWVSRLVGGDEGELARLRMRLVQAGLRSPQALSRFLVAKVVLAIVLPSIYFAADAMGDRPSTQGLPLAVILCAVGYLAPGLWLSSRVTQRQATISQMLPEALDLLVTCVEAGLGLDSALKRVADDMSRSAPELSEELTVTFLEANAGMRRPVAFQRLHERTGVDDLKSLAATLAQAERFGTSIGASLRMQSGVIRTRRMHAAEERAAMVSVKMTIPLVLCILPSLMAVILGPAAVNIHLALTQSMG